MPICITPLTFRLCVKAARVNRTFAHMCSFAVSLWVSLMCASRERRRLIQLNFVELYQTRLERGHSLRYERSKGWIEISICGS